jgi:hypothetical protein
MTYHNPATATLTEARHVVELIRKSLQYANGEDAADLSYELREWEAVVRERETPKSCIWKPCVATWAHSHGGFPGGYDNPADPEGPPIPFEGEDPDPTAVRDYNGAALNRPLRNEQRMPEGEARADWGNR